MNVDNLTFLYTLLSITTKTSLALLQKKIKRNIKFWILKKCIVIKKSCVIFKKKGFKMSTEIEIQCAQPVFKILTKQSMVWNLCIKLKKTKEKSFLTSNFVSLVLNFN